jgi:hypothetical protein
VKLETLDNHWLTAQKVWAKAKNVWDRKVSVVLAFVFLACVLCLIPWAIWDISFHPAIRKQVGLNLWHQALWIGAVYVLTKVWGWIKGAKRERTKVQSSEPQSWGRNHGGIKGRGERHGLDSSL